MTETPPELYPLALTVQSAHTQNLVYVGAEVADTLYDCLRNDPEQFVTVAVVMFPYLVNENNEAVIAAGPRRGSFTGKLVSVLLNDKKTNGRFVFSDGSIIYRDRNILE